MTRLLLILSIPFVFGLSPAKGPVQEREAGIVEADDFLISANLFEHAELLSLPPEVRSYTPVNEQELFIEIAEVEEENEIRKRKKAEYSSFSFYHYLDHFDYCRCAHHHKASYPTEPIYFPAVTPLYLSLQVIQV